MARVRLFCLVPLVALAATACAAVPKPVPMARLGSAEATITAAEQEGAATDPHAAESLRRAREDLARARLHIRAGEYEPAEQLLRRAEVEAGRAAWRAGLEER